MMGNAVSNFALGLVVYNHTNSTLLYSLFVIFNTLPKVIVPMLIGPHVDRTSRKKLIVRLDLISGLIYLCFSYLTYVEFFDFSIFILLGMFLGTIDSIYNVAYDSFYPELITEGNFSKAYSISSLLYPIANTIMVPIAGFAYKYVGVAPLFLFNAITFLITQAFERLIDADEKHLLNKNEAKSSTSSRKVSTSKSAYIADFKEGINYLRVERGLLAITAYFFITMMVGSVSGTLFLPYFTAQNQVTNYSILMAINTFGRMIGGFIHYKFRYPAKQKFRIAVWVYCIISVLEGALLFEPFPFMLLSYILVGMLAVTSFNIRISGTQNYIEPAKRGRFNGIFLMATMLGSIIGQFIAGILGDIFPIPYIIAAFMLINIISALVIMLTNKEHVKKIYNQDI